MTKSSKTDSKGLGISAKFSILMLIATLIPLILFLVITYVQTTARINASTEAFLDQTSRGLAGQVNEWVDKNVRALRTIAKQPDIVSMDRAKQEPILRAFRDEFPWMYLTFVIDAKGMNLSRSDDKPLVSFSDRKYVNDILSGKSIGLETVIGKSSKKPTLVIAVPIKVNQFTIGVMAGAMTLDNISEVVANSKIGKTGFAFLVDNLDNVVSHPNGDYTSSQINLSADPPIKAARNNTDNVTKIKYFTDESGKETVGTATAINYGWLVCIHQGYDEVFADIKNLKIYAFFVLIVSAGIAVLIALFAGRSLTTPILALADAAKKMSLGDMDVKIEIKSQDEIGVLAASITRLQASLRLAMKRLQKTQKDE
ncbi:MAG: HAMP domain-containing protein [Deltaproteobacteria bacterium]|nr:HAMP domain-containing protein [Deltaproteobacteria bacterium]